MNENDPMKYLYEFFDASLPRLGPGDDRSTKKALDIVLSELSKRGETSDVGKLRILDIGCGNGAQTLELAKQLDGDILAVDNHQAYLDELNRRAQAAGVSEKIRTRLMDMSELSRRDGIFDLIWSEGALNLMGFADGVLNPNGFRDGLVLCHGLLAEGGCLGVSELCWFRPDPPTECREFFANAYPAMTDIDTNLAIIKNAGYQVIGHFTLPESVWWESYCHPLEARLQSFRKKYATDAQQQDMIDSVSREIEIYRKHSSYYGYGFFLMQRSP